MPGKKVNPKRGGEGSRPPNPPSSGDTRANLIPAVPSSTTSNVLLPIVSTFEVTKMKTKTWKTESLDIEGLKSEESITMYGGSLCRKAIMPRKKGNPKRGGGGSRPPNPPGSGNTRANLIPAVPSSTTSNVLLPIISTFEVTKMKTKTWKTENLDIEGLKSEESITMYGGSLCREEFLYFLHSFQDFTESYDITTGKQLFGAFRSQLYGPAKQRWDSLTEGNAKVSVDDFKRFRFAWVCELFDTTDYDLQVHYLMEVKKPREMSIEKFIARIQTVALLVKYMPRETCEENENLTERIIKCIIYFACPQTWRQKFEDLDTNVTAPLPTILWHMKRQEALSPSCNTNNNSNRNGRPNNSGGSNSGGDNGGNNNSGGGSTTSTAGNGDKPRGSKLRNDAPCKLTKWTLPRQMRKR